MIITLSGFPSIDFEILKGQIKALLKEDIRMLCEWKQCEIQELSVQKDHIHLVVLVPLMVSVSKLMGTMKGKLAIKLFKSYPKMKQKPYWGNHFWARGYFVTSFGVDEELIKRYVK